MKTYECDIYSESEAGFDPPLSYYAPSPEWAASEYAEHAWSNHVVMWECPEGFDVWVREKGKPPAKRYLIGVEFSPTFTATEAEQ